MNQAYLLLGSNEGDRSQNLRSALEMLAAHGEITKQSPIYETSAWGLTDQAPFLNMAIELQTPKNPFELLTEIHNIELTLHRQRIIKWGPRTLDIDILLYNRDIIHSPDLTIPHPFLPMRRFALVPLADIAADYLHPILRQTISSLLFSCPDQLQVHKYTHL